MPTSILIIKRIDLIGGSKSSLTVEQDMDYFQLKSFSSTATWLVAASGGRVTADQYVQRFFALLLNGIEQIVRRNEYNLLVVTSRAGVNQIFAIRLDLMASSFILTREEYPLMSSWLC